MGRFHKTAMPSGYPGCFPSLSPLSPSPSLPPPPLPRFSYICAPGASRVDDSTRVRFIRQQWPPAAAAAARLAVAAAATMKCRAIGRAAAGHDYIVAAPVAIVAHTSLSGLIVDKYNPAASPAPPPCSASRGQQTLCWGPCWPRSRTARGRGGVIDIDPIGASRRAERDCRYRRLNN